MSINFMLTINENRKYKHGGNVEEFTNKIAEFDLGNHSVLRSICPVNEEGYVDDCGIIFKEDHKEITKWLQQSIYYTCTAAEKFINDIVPIQRVDIQFSYKIEWC